MNNPWAEVPLEDYENHMQLNTVCQLQALDQLMAGQLFCYAASTIMILGVAGGNGLRHLRSGSFDKVYGVDVNPAYLATCRQRYAALGEMLVLLEGDLTDPAFRLPQADLLLADLLVEYIGYEYFSHVVCQVEPQVVSCVIQLNEGESFVSDSPYLHVFDPLCTVHRQMEQGRLTDTMRAIGYQLVLEQPQPLPNGKALLRLDYRKEKEA